MLFQKLFDQHFQLVPFRLWEATSAARQLQSEQGGYRRFDEGNQIAPFGDGIFQALHVRDDSCSWCFFPCCMTCVMDYSRSKTTWNREKFEKRPDKSIQKWCKDGETVKHVSGKQHDAKPILNKTASCAFSGAEGTSCRQTSLSSSVKYHWASRSRPKVIDSAYLKVNTS